MQQRKAQLAYEYLLLVFFLTALFTIGAIITGAVKAHAEEESLALHIEDLGRSIQEDFYTTIEQPQGFTRNLTLPTSISGEPYEAKVRAYQGISYLDIEAQGSTKTFTLPQTTVMGQPSKPPATNTLTVKDGTIILN